MRNVRHIGAALVEFELDFGGAAHRLDRAGKLGDHAVAGAAEHTPIMGLDQFIDNFAISLEGGEGRFLVLAHEPGVPNHIGREDRGETTLDAFSRHRPFPPRRALRWNSM